MYHKETSVLENASLTLHAPIDTASSKSLFAPWLQTPVSLPSVRAFVLRRLDCCASIFAGLPRALIERLDCGATHLANS